MCVVFVQIFGIDALTDGAIEYLFWIQIEWLLTIDFILLNFLFSKFSYEPKK